MAGSSESLSVSHSQMVQGGTGLIQTPTARMGPEGDFSVNYTDNNEYRFWSVSLQLFDWMEATARYTDVRTRLYSQVESFSGDQTLKDKGLDVKFRLLEESFYLPQLAVGFRDFGGTGFFESEYVSASKAWGPVDFHLGLGWGYLGTHDDITNPFCKLKDSFCSRPVDYSGRGGKVDYNQFFKGPMAVFGGIEYQTPWEPLRLKLEYEGNNYQYDRAGELEQDSRWNLGAVYRWNNFDLSLNYQRGNTIGFGISYRFNMNTFSQVKVDRPPRSLMQSEPAADIDTLDRTRLYQDLFRQGSFILSDTDINEQSATFYGHQIAYRNPKEAIERVGRILASELPESVKTYQVVENSGKIPMLNTVIDADAFKAAARYEGLESKLEDTYLRVTPDDQLVEGYEPARQSGAFFSTDIFWTQTFGSPEDFYLYQGGLIFGGGYSIDRKWTVSGSIRATVLDNFDKFTYKVDKEDSTLPRVRTYVREYVDRSVGIDTGFVHWADRIDDDWYLQAYGGYLETMFGGVGGEVLYRPVDSNLAFGVDLNFVQQRSYENVLGFFDYKTFTGHASVYWKPQWSALKGTQISVSAGQFLAKDKGVNIDFAKRFDSGIVVGAYAAFTNVSADEYGEGSFTKGFYLSIPFDLFVVKPAKGRGRFPWVPISRDGGQMLNRPIRLMDMTEVRAPFYD
nr:YjbH domain-containing protein [Alteromonas aestuariivivens]